MTQPSPFPRPYKAGPARFNVGLEPLIGPWLHPGIDEPKRALLSDQRDQVYRALDGSHVPEAEAHAAIQRLASVPSGLEGTSLWSAAHLVDDDLVLMQRLQGQWVCTAACLCSPTFFTVHHVVGNPLGTLHEPVLTSEPSLANRIGRVFDGLRPDLILQRHNWTIQAGPERFTPNISFLRARADEASPDQAHKLLHLRVERQTIRLLPETASVLFTIGVSTEPLAKIFADPHERACFAQAWHTTAPEVARYKGWHHLAHLVSHMLTSDHCPKNA